MRTGVPCVWMAVNWCAATNVQKCSINPVTYRWFHRCPMKVKRGNACCATIWPICHWVSFCMMTWSFVWSISNRFYLIFQSQHSVANVVLACLRLNWNACNAFVWNCIANTIVANRSETWNQSPIQLIMKSFKREYQVWTDLTFKRMSWRGKWKLKLARAGFFSIVLKASEWIAQDVNTSKSSDKLTISPPNIELNASFISRNIHFGVSLAGTALSTANNNPRTYLFSKRNFVLAWMVNCAWKSSFGTSPFGHGQVLEPHVS